MTTVVMTVRMFVIGKFCFIEEINFPVVSRPVP